jgi:hypothetical protein
MLMFIESAATSKFLVNNTMNNTSNVDQLLKSIYLMVFLYNTTYYD